MNYARRQQYRRISRAGGLGSGWRRHSLAGARACECRRLSRISPATQASGPVEDEWLRDSLVAIAQLAESLDQVSFEPAMRIVPFDWWASQLPERPPTAENLRT